MSTALFLVGYGLAIPIGMRLGHVARTGNRLALAGHQVGVVIALVGWLLRGSVALTVAHVVWLVAARIWFSVSGPTDTTTG